MLLFGVLPFWNDNNIKITAQRIYNQIYLYILLLSLSLSLCK